MHSDDANAAPAASVERRSLLEGRARVIRRDGDRLWLSSEPPAACGGCATRGLCGGGTRAPRQWQVPAAPAGDALRPGDALRVGDELQVGDELRVGIDRAALARASLVGYGGPLLATLLAAVGVSAAGGSDGAAAVAAVFGLTAGIALARLIVRRWSARLAPVVLGPAERCAPGGCGGSQ